ncbi:Holliday junction resolvase RuvX [Aeromicrobium wangtongii]|uniref:Putative pre-16S rRNA nuclease n=1 Tax=Aeromicrobium wangtongii TaxID=2969247 RepID=A0ABY5M5L5_9ACTN|nr:Holliday junction resolvase RuvX [Aeromicrobium wangtongii]MCD9198182.1 Holliday junction resolvase RuvX [Aeromicrobium wangtongii]UUP12220.1 Holliday junction resolvase RuvX [Aeromicrobium wangtongii]
MTTRRGRRLGVDVGDVRIGVAISDPDGILATPVETVPAGQGAIKRLAEIVREYDVFECIVGLPMGLSGREGPAAIKVRAFCDELSAAIDPVPIRLFDERMSTITADSMLRESGRSGRGKRSIIDQAAATVILQTALDSERSRGSAPGESM